MLSVFNGFYTYSLKETVPFFTHIAIVLLIVALLYDYFRRRVANDIIKAINDVGAHSPHSALDAARLDEILGRYAAFGRYMLKNGSTLRRYVKRARFDSGVGYFIPLAPDSSDSSQRESTNSPQQDKGANSPRGENAVESPSAPRLPSSLRGGGERSLKSVIVSIVLLIVFGELFIRFFPTLYEYIFGNSKNLFS